MGNEMTGRRTATLATGRAAMAGMALLLAGGLGACTTVEGTNAMTDFGTFERDVMTSTLQGLGAVPQESKPPLATARGPLVLPKPNATVQPPTQAAREAALLPEDSDNVEIDTASLSQADIDRLKHARVADLRTTSGRPLTDAETRQLLARFKGTVVQGKRSLIFPPDEYFTAVNGKDMVCLAENGDLVPIGDRRCPPTIQRALGIRGAGVPQLLGSGPSEHLTANEIGDD
jgi:hypothetical protein